MNPEQIKARRAELAAEADTILKRSDGPMTDEERTRLTGIESELDDLKLLERAAASFEAGAYEGSDSNVDNRGPQHLKRTDPWEGETRTSAPADLKARALTAIERTNVGTDEAREAATKIVQRQDAAVAEWAVVGSDPAYASAFAKVLGDPANGQHRWDDAERHAFAKVLDWQSRAMSEGTTTAGGFMVPTHLDPAVMLSSDGSASSFRQVVRVEQLGAGKTWNGISSAGITASYSTEFAVVPDGSPTIANPQIPVYKGHAFVVGSIEVIEDVSSLGQEIAMLFADARTEADNAVFATGTGTNQPTGIVTALTGVAGSWTSCATNSSLVAADFYKVRRALGPRFRGNASWMMNIGIDDSVRQLGDDKLHQQSVDFRAGSIGNLLGAPVYELSGLDAAATTTTNSIAVYADFKRSYCWVDRVGSSIEFVPHLLDQATGRPYGARGWYMHWRSGGDSVNDAAGVLMVNQNTAFL